MMGRQLSLDIRERVVWLVEKDGLSRREAARRVMISVSSAIRIMDQKRRTGCVAPARMGRPKRSKLDAVNDWLRAKVTAQPDLTMPELAADLALSHQMTATPAMLSRHLIHRLGLTYKKRR